MSESGNYKITAKDKEFVASIVADPDDDTIRLVYADWLEEQGRQDRADFIRAQIELSTPPQPRSKTRRRNLTRMTKNLWEKHGERWHKEPGGGDEKIFTEWGSSSNFHLWERGFFARNYVRTMKEQLAELPELVKKAPIQYLDVADSRRADVARLIKLSILQQMKGITLFCSSFEDELKISDKEIAKLVKCPYLTRLEKLDLTQHDIGAEGIRLISHADTMPNLCELHMYGNNWTDEGLQILAESPLASRLRYLHVSGVTAKGVRNFVKAPALKNLKVLKFDNADVRDSGAKAIAKSPHLFGLTELWLHMCEINDAGIIAIANSPHLTNLEYLDITSNWTVGHAAAVALVESPYMKGLQKLDMWRCEGLSAEDERMLRNRFRSRVNFGRSY